MKLDWHEAQPKEVDASGEAILRQHWPHVLEPDPFYDPNLSRERAGFSVELSPK